MRALLIDDEEDMRRIGRVSLARIGGMDVREASSGEAGIAAAEADPPDVILLDVLMPGLDGPATLAELKRRPATAGVPVIFLTGTTAPEALAHLLSLGAHGVIGKPFDPLSLSRKVRELLGTPP